MTQPFDSALAASEQILNDNLLVPTMYRMEILTDGAPPMPLSNVLVLDIETSAYEDKDPSAFAGNSRPIMIGVALRPWSPGDHELEGLRIATARVLDTPSMPPVPPADILKGYETSDTPLVVVGCNIKFDLHHLRKLGIGAKLFSPDVMLWDISLAHYLLTGQRDTMPSMKTAAERYLSSTDPRLAQKDVLHENMKAGIMPQDMDANDLRKYLRNDLGLTYIVACYQMHEVMESGRAAFFFSQMKALRACIEMEWNGLAVSPIEASIMAGRVHQSIIDTRTKLTGWFRALASEWPAGIPIPVLSSKTLDVLYYGGTLMYDTKEQVGVFKSGAKKGLPRMITKSNPVPVPATALMHGYIGKHKLTPSGERCYDEDELDSIINYLNSYPSIRTTHESAQAKFLETLLEHRKLHKIEGTYLTPVIAAGDAGIIHHTLHQTNTATGRLSCAKPNLQNLPSFSDESIDVKKLYVSRYKGGNIIEADYKQIEMVALAIRSGDAQLRADLEMGVDIHAATGSHVFGHSMTKEQRRVVKGVNFGLIYGAGAFTLAKTAGCSEGTAKKLMSAFFRRYPGVKTYREAYTADVKRHLVLVGDVTRKNGSAIPEYVSSDVPDTFRDGSSGRRFHMVTENGEPPYTKCCNYPIQALATGDVVPLVMGHLFQAIERSPDFSGRLKMINQVHDSLMFDCPGELTPSALVFIKHEMEKASDLVTQTLGVPFDLKLTANVTCGHTWRDSSLAE